MVADFEGGVSVNNVVEIKVVDNAPLLVVINDDGVGEVTLG